MENKNENNTPIKILKCHIEMDRYFNILKKEYINIFCYFKTRKKYHMYIYSATSTFL